jgi:DNA invertase Pin-like site-specific DNA recombinase
MKFGYARVSTKEQNLNLQMDALKKAGCKEIFHETVSGAKTKRVELDRLLSRMRHGDVLVIWKLDRLGRSLKHLVLLVHEFIEKGIGLQSLNDPIDTTTSEGRLIFNIFASLAEFERDLISQRTRAGLQAARARGRTGGRPKGLSEQAQRKAIAAEALYKEGRLSVAEICHNLTISKASLYKYLRHQGVQVSTFHKRQAQKIIEVQLWLRVERNSKFVRGKKKARQEIENYVLAHFDMKKKDADGSEYMLKIPYANQEDLEKTVYQIYSDMEAQADSRNCFIEADITNPFTGYSF